MIHNNSYNTPRHCMYCKHSNDWNLPVSDDSQTTELGRDARTCQQRTDVIKTRHILFPLPVFRFPGGPGGLQEEFWTLTLTKLLLFFFKLWGDWDTVIFSLPTSSHLLETSMYLGLFQHYFFLCWLQYLCFILKDKYQSNQLSDVL